MSLTVKQRVARPPEDMYPSEESMSALHADQDPLVILIRLEEEELLDALRSALLLLNGNEELVLRWARIITDPRMMLEHLLLRYEKVFTTHRRVLH